MRDWILRRLKTPEKKVLRDIRDGVFTNSAAERRKRYIQTTNKALRKGDR